MNKELITGKRCLIAVVWAYIVIVGMGNIGESGMGWLLAAGAAGLPWLIFLLQDRNGTEMRTGVAEGILTSICGSVLSFACGIPIVIVVNALKHFLK